MKILFFTFLLLFTRLKTQEHYCGYYGSAATQIERDLDGCMQENLKQDRVQMSLGFENCTGFNFSVLEDKVAEPVRNKEEEINKSLIGLSFDVCKFKDDPSKSEDLSDDQILERKKIIDKCKEYFDKVIQTVFDAENLSSILEEDDEPLVDILEEQEYVDEIKGKIQTLVQPISKCKGPQKELENRLKEKYLKQYLEKITNPTLPSFSWDNVDVLLHPDIYIMKNDENFEVPNFEQESVHKSNDQMILIPREKIIKMNSMGEELSEKSEQHKQQMESKQFWDKLKFWRSKESIQQDNQELKDMENQFMINTSDWNENHEHHTNDLISQDEKKGSPLYQQKVQIQNFWDKDINIKNKRINDEDYDRYKIKDWDIDSKIDRLFNIKKLI